MVEQMSVKETARAMGKPEQFVRMGLRQGVFPWGYAVKMSGEYSYFINKKSFEQIEGGIEHETKSNDLDNGGTGIDDSYPVNGATYD